MAATTDQAGAERDSADLARFGYRQELTRSLGIFSSFAVAFSYISPSTFNIGFLNQIPILRTVFVVIAVIGVIYYVAAGHRKEFSPVQAPAGDDAPLQV